MKVKGQGQISGAKRSILGARLCRVQQRAKKSHYQSRMFVCVSNDRADAVDRVLIIVYGSKCTRLVLWISQDGSSGLYILWKSAPFWIGCLKIEKIRDSLKI